MDRWGEDDDDLEAPSGRGRVARVGLGGFVKEEKPGSGGNACPNTIPRVEVVPSRKVRKEMESKKKMPPPPAPSLVHSPKKVESNAPRVRLQLEVYKDGSKIQDVTMRKELTILGRHATADVVLDHASISRQHATIRFHPSNESWTLEDLGSVHGTFMDDKRMEKGVPVKLVDGKKIRFGASTRTYAVKMKHSGKRGIKGQDGNTKRQRVRFPDDEDGGVGGSLEQVIGYSDSNDFAVQVGPRPVEKGEKGQFDRPPAMSIEGLTGLVEPTKNGRKLKGSIKACPLSPTLKKVIEEVKRPPGKTGKGGGLYDEVPPSKEHGGK